MIGLEPHGKPRVERKIVCVERKIVCGKENRVWKGKSCVNRKIAWGREIHLYDREVRFVESEVGQKGINQSSAKENRASM